MLDPVGSEPRRRTDDLAAELLDVVNTSELQRFLGDLAAETARDAGRPIRADVGRALIPVLRRTVERTLPTLSIAVADDPRPLAGAAPAAARAASRVYGVELEGMSAEDRDFEIARRFVHFARAAMARASAGSAPDPATAVADAIAQAGREHAPGLVPPRRGGATAP
jgi:hypothetical protein